MATFSLVPLGQTSLSGSAYSSVAGSNTSSGTIFVNYTPYSFNASSYPDISLQPTTSGGGGVTYPTVGQLYPYY